MVGLVLAALAVYRNSFSVPLLLDDSGAIAENPSIRHLGPIASALFPPSNITSAGRPLFNFTLAVNYALGGTAVGGYHAVNLLIHILAGLTLFGIVRRTLVLPMWREKYGAHAVFLALAVAGLWTLHPVQTEAVTYISQRSELLMGLCYLLTLYGAIRGATSPRPGVWYGLAVVAGLLGTASKEVMVTAPLMVLLYDRTFLAGSFRKALKQRGPLYAGLVASWCVLAFLMVSTDVRHRGIGFEGSFTGWTYALTECRVVVEYLRLTIWPHPLVFDYGLTWNIRDAMQAAPYAGLLVVLLGAMGLALRRWPIGGFLGCWFFVILAPTSSIVPVEFQPMAESRMYLPLAGVVTLGVLGLYAVMGRRSAAIFLILAATFGVLAAQRNADYRSELSLWSDTVARRPDNYRARNNLADVLVRLGRDQEAIGHCETALRLKPSNAALHNTLGNALDNTGRHAEAIVHYEEALRLEPGFVEAHNNLGNVLSTMPGRLPEAVAHFEMALRIRPDFAAIHFNLGNALLDLPGRRQEALTHYQAALRLDPGLRAAREMLEKLAAERRE
jgi:protein O-mannosyl-transferase